MTIAPVVAKRARDLPAFRISPHDTNCFACLLDPIADGVDFTLVVEIFQPGGRTPPNVHRIAHETFFVLHGSGLAQADGRTQALSAGDLLLLKPGVEHVIENTGAGKLYCLTLMTPDEGFAALIRNGIPVALDAEDIAILSRVARDT